jgi:hypothetical protein
MLASDALAAEGGRHGPEGSAEVHAVLVAATPNAPHEDVLFPACTAVVRVSRGVRAVVDAAAIYPLLISQLPRVLCVCSPSQRLPDCTPGTIMKP